MAKFDVFRTHEGTLLLDCQADLLEHLQTRFVVPLCPERDAPKPAARLNPIFGIEGDRYVMVTQFAGTVPVREIGDRVCSLLAEQDRVSLALDMLIAGF
ncbi:MAG: CcdB family protein [Novosphingobium sp.]|uniref:CcdB family protein n=1 Tax=Novosphingobium sp. TaxID=1874826 RepID=UPI0027370CC5|nr:CcdB family protein [Novosphingobium sp.]MDP3551188.1 CcdB family protein [Novosphingobium sp.]